MLQTDNLEKDLQVQISKMKRNQTTIENEIEKLENENETANDARKAHIANQLAELRETLKKLSQ